MRWDNTETPALEGTPTPAQVEVLSLVDRDGNVLKTYTKSADGTLSETTQKVTPAVARVVTATIDTALSDDDSVLHFGNLVITEGVQIAGDDDGTELFPYLAAHLALIPAEDFVDNEDGTCDIIMRPGANDVAFSSGDSKLTFSDTDGADAITEQVPVAPNQVMTYQGSLDCSGNPNYPAANAGDVYRVSVGGKIGGASGDDVDAGNRLICNVDDSDAGDKAAVGANWDIEVNIDTTGIIDDTAYNATTWNAVVDVAPSKNAVRDKIEAIVGGVTPCADGTVSPVTSITTVKGIITAIS